MHPLVILVYDMTVHALSDTFLSAPRLMLFGSIIRWGEVLAVLEDIFVDLARYLCCVRGIICWIKHLARSFAMLDPRLSVGLFSNLDVHLKIIEVFF